MDYPLHFVSGLPRSGSTLLMNALGQNPELYVTPTSGLIHLVRQAIHRWPRTREFQAQGLDQVKPHVLGGLRGLLYGFYEAQFSAGKVVLDKSRGWLQYIEPVEEILERQIKVLVMVRDIRSIVASFESLYQSRGIDYQPPRGRSSHEGTTIEQRARRILGTTRVVGRSVGRVRDAVQRCPDRLLVIPYQRFCENPRQTLAAIDNMLGVGPFEYDPDHVEQLTHEDDNYNGLPLHTIRPIIEPQPADAWREILPEQLTQQLAEEYADLNQLAAGPLIDRGTAVEF